MGGTNNTITISGGTAGALSTQATSTVTVSSGTLASLTSTGATSLNLTGGTISGNVSLSGVSPVNITGGTLGGTLNGSSSDVTVNPGAGTFATNGAWNVRTVTQSSGAFTVSHDIGARNGGFALNGGVMGVANNVTLDVGTGGLFTNASGGTGGSGNAVGLSILAGKTASISSTTTGGYTQTATGIFQTNFAGHAAGGTAPATTFGKLAVTGTAALPADAKIDVNVATGASLVAGTTLPSVIASTGTLTATTFAVTDNNSLFDFVATKNGNAIDLSIVAAAAPAANRPLMSTGVKGSIFSFVWSGNRIVQAREEANKGLSSGDEFLGDRKVWFKPMGSWAKQDDNSNISGYKANTYGGVLGIDAITTQKVRAGVAFSYTSSKIKSNRTFSTHDADVDSYRLIGYGSYSIDDKTDISFQGDIGTATIKGNRLVDLGAGGSTRALSDYKNLNWHLGLGLAKIIDLSPATTFTPSIRADYAYAKDKAYREADAMIGATNYALDVRANKADQFIVSVDGKFNHSLSDHSSVSANLGLGYDTKAKRSSLTSVAVGGAGGEVVTTGMDPQRTIFRGGLGYLTHTDKTSELSVRYDVETRKGYVNHTASIKYRISF